MNRTRILSIICLLIFISSSSNAYAISDVGENCKELFPGHNGPVDERINLVFMSFNYGNIDEFLEKVRPLVDINDVDNSFFSFEPLRSNMNKFNLWYVDRAEQTSYIPTFIDPYPDRSADFDPKWKKLSSECIMPGNLKILVPVINSGALSPVLEYYSGEEAKLKGFTALIRLQNSAMGGGDTTLNHEFGHAFGKFYDEYEVGSRGFATINALNSPPNCDNVDANIACPKWCKGRPIEVSVLKKEECSHLDINSCLNLMSQGSSCFLIGGDGSVGKANSCINMIDYCTSIEEKIACEDTKNNFYFEPLCSWLDDTEGEHPYYKARCIPTGNVLNIGSECVDGTGCYSGCTGRGIFRSVKQGIMRQLGQSYYGVYNEKLLCDRIKELTGSVGGRFTCKLAPRTDLCCPDGFVQSEQDLNKCVLALKEVEKEIQCPDFNGDGYVGYVDFLMLNAKFGASSESEEYEIAFDLNKDRKISFDDIVKFIRFFGCECENLTEKDNILEKLWAYLMASEEERKAMEGELSGEFS